MSKMKASAGSAVLSGDTLLSLLHLNDPAITIIALEIKFQ
jgi:hypothetical protein